LSRYVFDIETDGLLDVLTRCWIIVAKDIDTKRVSKWYEGDLSWRPVFDKASLVVGHNILGFDLPALEKLFGYRLPKTVMTHDTMLMSLIMNYKRFGNDGHSMEVWGEHLSQPKQEHEDWTQFSPEMESRCVTDVDLNEKMYRVLMQEVKSLAAKEPKILTYLKAEHAVSKWCSAANLYGWPFDVPTATILLDEMLVELTNAREKITPLLGAKTVAVDKCKGVVESKKPKWVKSGAYDAHLARWFDINPYSGQDDDRLVEGEYCRVEFVNLSLDNSDDVKLFLFRHGWEPTEFNYKKDPITGRKIQSSPKVTEDSLELLEGNGKLYTDFLTTKSRYGLLKGWLENVDSNGVLHGDCFTIGTPSMRARHSIIVNVPSPEVPWGKEIRQLFITKPGWKLIGCDSAGNQARGLAHYLGSPEFIDVLLNGDIHQKNADTLTNVLKDMGIDFKVSRASAKRILYAFLFGASGKKLWSYIFGVMDVEKGNKLKLGFIKAVPGFKDLLDKLENIFGKTKQFGHGYIPSIAGNRIYVDSFHKLLVYLLQSCEKATCSAAVMLTMERLEAANIPYQPVIMMHDEEDFLVPEEFAEEAAAIGKQAFVDGPKLFGIEIMDGSAKIGNNWYDIH